jgi:hypothetical protein
MPTAPINQKQTLEKRLKKQQQQKKRLKKPTSPGGKNFWKKKYISI